MKLVVVDACVAVKWFLPEPHTDFARRVLGDDYVLHAPDFMLVEIDNILCKHIRRGLIPAEKADYIRQAVSVYPIRFEPDKSLRHSAFALATQTLCSAYDALYLALAVRVQAEVVTADQRFYDNLARSPYRHHVRWIADVPQP